MKRAIFIVLLAALGLWITAKLFPPPLREGIATSQAIYDRQGKLLRLSLTPDEKYRVWTGLHDISPALIEATLQEEDRYFYFHPGVNPLAISRAAFQNLFQKGRLGASTITMQLARLRYDLNTKSVWGKIKQSWLALRLELAYSKREILEAYLNLAPYGLNIEGGGAASLIYFHKRSRELSVAEALLLVALPQSPTERSPHAKGGAALSYVKQKLAAQWVRRHPEDKDRLADLTRSLPIYLPRELPFEAPHFCDDISQRYSHLGHIETTLSLSLQKVLKRQVETFVRARRSTGIQNAAAILIDHRSMELVAAVGSAQYFNADIQGQVNGTRSPRSPGSTLKPFLYALALEQGLVHPLTILKDSPRRFGNLNPENSDLDFMGPVSTTKALNLSRNLPALFLMSQLKSQDLYDWLVGAGISFPERKEHYGLGLALGGAEMTLEQLATLYTVFPNRGYLSDLRKIAHDPIAPPRALLSEGAAFLVQEMLRQNVPPGRENLVRIHTSSEPVAWKTGTSHGFKDAWTIGISGPYVIGIWVGDFEGRGNPAFVGRESAAPLFFAIKEALPAVPDTELAYPAPAEVTKVAVCEISGGLPGPYCRHKRETWFMPGKSPIHTCQVHRAIYVHNRSGLRTCERLAADSHLEVFEFWDSDLMRLFRRAGMGRRPVPALDERCLGAVGKGSKPEITSPVKDLAYALRSNDSKLDRIPLIASLEGGKKTLYWFIDESYLGTSGALEPLYWKAVPGRHIVRAVDDFGNADARELTVTVAD